MCVTWVLYFIGIENATLRVRALLCGILLFKTVSCCGHGEGGQGKLFIVSVLLLS